MTTIQLPTRLFNSIIVRLSVCYPTITKYGHHFEACFMQILTKLKSKNLKCQLYNNNSVLDGYILAFVIQIH